MNAERQAAEGGGRSMKGDTAYGEYSEVVIVSSYSK